MSVTQPYQRNVSFKTHSLQTPQKPHNGADIDHQFDLIGLSFTNISSALADIRREDGQLKNGVVTGDSLAPDLASDLSAEIVAELLPLQQMVQNNAQQAALSAGQSQQAANQAGQARQQAQQAVLDIDQSQEKIEQYKSIIQTKADHISQIAQDMTQTALAAEQASENSKNFQIGSETAYHQARQAAEIAQQAVGPSASHLKDQDNPHQVTHVQVGSDLAHWNAKCIMDKPVSVDNRKADGLQRVIVWDPAKDHYTHAVFSALSGGGLKYPINWINEGEGRILVLREDGKGGFVWLLEPKPQRGKKGVNDFVDLADTPAMIEVGKALIGHQENGLKSLIWTEIYNQAQIDALLVPITLRLDQIQDLFAKLQADFNIEIQTLNQMITDLSQQILQLSNLLPLSARDPINNMQAASRLQIWAGF